jgi:hypothetical protein
MTSADDFNKMAAIIADLRVELARTRKEKAHIEELMELRQLLHDTSKTLFKIADGAAMVTHDIPDTLLEVRHKIATLHADLFIVAVNCEK